MKELNQVELDQVVGGYGPVLVGGAIAFVAGVFYLGVTAGREDAKA